MPLNRDEDKARGSRAEQVANWYFRLNGFFLLPSYVLHLDRDEPRVTQNGERKSARTEVDLLGVRFPRSTEYIYRGTQKTAMADDERLTSLSNGTSATDSPRTVFAIVEVKASTCGVNGPWSNPKNMPRAISRFGFAAPNKVEAIAVAMVHEMHWSDRSAVVQYICVGKSKSDNLSERHPGLLQITFDEIGEFLFDRFTSFPEKLPGGPVHAQWPEFGREYATWFQRQRRVRDGKQLSGEATVTFIAHGRLP